MKWIRTCQECGHKQKCPRPVDHSKPPSNAYCYRACKKCGSEALDYGYDVPETPAEIEAQRKYDESLIKLDEQKEQKEQNGDIHTTEGS